MTDVDVTANEVRSVGALTTYGELDPTTTPLQFVFGKSGLPAVAQGAVLALLARQAVAYAAPASAASRASWVWLCALSDVRIELAATADAASTINITVDAINIVASAKPWRPTSVLFRRIFISLIIACFTLALIVDHRRSGV